MGRGNKFTVTQVVHRPDHHDGRFQVSGAIVNSRDQVVMHICYQSREIGRLV